MQEESKWFDTKELSNRVVNNLENNPLTAEYNFDAYLIELAIEAAFNEIGKEVGKCERPVILDNIGTFQLEGRQARKHVNPQTGEPLEKPAYQKLKFKPAKALREEIEKHLPDIHSGKRVK